MFIDGFGEQYRPADHGHGTNHGARHEYNDNNGRSHDDDSSSTNNGSGYPHAR
jgi:hypothetical protein